MLPNFRLKQRSIKLGGRGEGCSGKKNPLRLTRGNRKECRYPEKARYETPVIEGEEPRRDREDKIRRKRSMRAARNFGEIFLKKPQTVQLIAWEGGYSKKGAGGKSAEKASLRKPIFAALGRTQRKGSSQGGDNGGGGGREAVG